MTALKKFCRRTTRFCSGTHRVYPALFFDFTVCVRAFFAGLIEDEMDRNYVLIVDEAKSQLWLPSFDVARYKKTTQKKKHDRERTEKRRATMPCTTAPRPHYAVTKLSDVCLAHPLRCCKQKKKHQQNQDKHGRQRNARKTNNHIPLDLTMERPTPSCLPGAPASMLQAKIQKKDNKTHRKFTA